MKATRDQLERGYAASCALRDHGDPAAGVKPVSFTGDPFAHLQVIGDAMLRDVKPDPLKLFDFILDPSLPPGEARIYQGGRLVAIIRAKA